MPEITKVVPLDEALAALDSAEADADRTRRAEKWAEELKAQSGPGPRSIALDFYARVVHDVGRLAYDEALLPLRFGDSYSQPSESQRHRAEQEAQRNVDVLVVRQLKIYLRARDVQEIYADPDRMEQGRVWNAYLHQVDSICFTKGDKAPIFIARFLELVAARNDAEAYDDADGVRAAEARLDRLTAPVTYPRLPQAAWEQADLLPEGVRQEELDRLRQKYGDRPGTDAPTNGNGKTPRGRRRTMTPTQALSTREGART